jgi:carboxymethylenebutenolidase
MDTNQRSEFDSLRPHVITDRRTFLVGSLATGFALAVQPVSAQTITTDTAGLTAGEVKIPAKDVEMPAYRAMPAEGGPFPTVLVVQEVFGVHEYIKDVCRRLAKQGYCAIAPELYVRQGDPSKVAEIPKIISDIVSKVSDAQVMADLDATVAWAKSSGKADTGRLGITGFCWGGRIVWMYAAHNPGVKAGVAWYGRLVGMPSEMSPKQPIDIAKDLKAPVLGLYGGADQGIPIDTVDKMRDAMRAAKKPGDLIVFPDAPHAFHADYRPSYRKDQAEEGWQRLLSWFKVYL